jgi:PTS system nitrogen regulatory IIA component
LRTTVAVPFDAPGHRPVSLFLALVVPKQATEHHLQLLANAAAMFNDRVVRDKLRAGPDPATVRELLTVWPDSPVPGGGEIGATPESSAGSNLR